MFCRIFFFLLFLILFTVARAPTFDSQHLKIMSFNLEHFRGEKPRIKLLGEFFKKYLKFEDWPLILVQEIENQQAMESFCELFNSTHECFYSKESQTGVVYPRIFTLNHVQMIGPMAKKRPMVELQFKFYGHYFSVVNNHWPSQMHSFEQRERYAQALENRMSLLEGPTIVAGDFNLVKNEWQRLKKRFLNHFIVQYKNLNECHGTYFYSRKRSWHQFDGIFINGKMESEILCPRSIQTLKKFDGTFYFVPKKYRTTEIFISKQGLSDHYPVISTFALKF